MVKLLLTTSWTPGSGKAISNGARKLEDMIGQKFNLLTVVERAGTGKNRDILWLCKCDCGGDLMNDVNKIELKKLLRLYLHKNRKDRLTCIDVGSYDVNGNIKDMMRPRWKYIGLDIVEGPNVDIKMPGEYEIPLKSESIDIAFSLSTIQYVKNPFKWVKEISRCIKTEGWIFLCAPRLEKEGLIGLPESLCPNEDTEFDCWRILLEGMKALLEEGKFSVEKVCYKGRKLRTCWGVGVKKR
jgi:hypothetical protein